MRNVQAGNNYFARIARIDSQSSYPAFFGLVFCCCIFSFWITYTISSTKFMKSTKNYAILCQSALMGAFLSVILPTYTVVILLIALSIYDIYSVRHGPIKDIITYSMEDEEQKYSGTNNDFHSRNIRTSITNQPLPMIPRNVVKNSDLLRKSQQLLTVIPKLCLRVNVNFHNDNNNATNTAVTGSGRTVTNNYDANGTDFLLNSMTYSAKDWDIGIGDLVFYSLLASQPLTPYFILNHGSGLMENFGVWIFWLISLFTIIGILIGFVITIHLLERNSMLPGLPCSIALGLIGFLGSTFILSIV